MAITTNSSTRVKPRTVAESLRDSNCARGETRLHVNPSRRDELVFISILHSELRQMPERTLEETNATAFQPVDAGALVLL
jgi:hypothetical protein